MTKEEYTIKLDMIATFEDKQIRVEDLLEQLFKENKQLKEENEFFKSEIEEGKRIFQKDLEYIDERDERINKAIELLILKQNSFGGIRNVSDVIEILKGDSNE